MKRFFGVFSCAALLICLLSASPAHAYHLVSMQPHYDRFEVFTDEPLVVVADQSLDLATVNADNFTVFDERTGAYLTGIITVETTTLADDTLVFTPESGTFPFAHRLRVGVDSTILDIDGQPLIDALPKQGYFVANIPDDLERPVVNDPNGFPVELYVNANVLLGFNPLDPESDTSNIMNYVPGMSATEAWKLWTGDPDVLVAVIDVGINKYSNLDLAERLFLNRGELPQPTISGDPCADWDCNGDGRFSAYDYVDDPSVYDADASGNIDPGDLIALLSDEIDNDGNGYVDDISGWDFFRNKNLAVGVPQFPEGVHGTMRAEDVVGIANNGEKTKPGFCPDCSVLSVRVGEAIVTEFNLLTAGMEYAVAMGAQVVIVAMGVANYSYEAEMAFVDAYDSGVFVVAASGDELGFHHVYPAAGEDVYSVKGVLPLPPVEWGPLDPMRLAFVESYCTNHGASIDATGVTGACSSEATSNIGGIAGLLISYAKSRGMDLSPGEIRQLLNMTAEDINQACLALNLKGCRDGWEENWGYGRVNAHRAILALGDPVFGIPERIPPDVRIVSPRWWTTMYANETPTFDVEGSVYARGRPYTWELQLGFGVEPTDDEFVSLTTGNGQEYFEGKLATINIMEFVDENWLRRRPEKSNDFTVTLRFRGWWQPEDDEPVLGEIRKAIAWHIDNDPETGLMPGFPKFMGASGVSSPLYFDMDGDADGALEVVFATANPSVEMYKYDADAHTLEIAPGFPVTLPAHPDKSYDDAVIASVAVGQVFGDGVPYIAVATNHGFVYLLHADGNNHAGGPFVEGFPVSAMEPDNTNGLTFAHGNAFMASPVLADLDADGTLEIIAASYDQHLYAWKAVDEDNDGQADAMPGFPVPLRSDEQAGLVPRNKICETNMPAQVLGTPAVGIVDPDNSDPDIAGHPAIIVPTSESCTGGLLPTGRVYAVYWNGLENEDGPFLPGWPAEVLMPLGDELPIPPLTIGMTSSPAATIYEGELLVGVGSFFWLPQIIHWDGEQTTIEHLPSRLNLGVTANGSFGRFGDDDSLWYFFPTAGLVQATENGFRLATFNIVGWDLADRRKVGWRKNYDDINFFVNPVIADLDADGSNEVIAGSGGYLLHANNIDLDEPDGWPKFTQNWATSSVVVGDVDGDRVLDVTSVTQEGNLFAWRTRGASCNGDRPAADWHRFHHDPHNTGFYGADAVPPRLVRDLHVFTTDDPDRFEFQFTAPGDDEDCGLAAMYDLRFSTDADADLRDPAVWAAATAVDGPTPVVGGTDVVATIEAPDGAAFALRSYDDAGWVSYVSNIAQPEAPTDDDDDDDDDSTPVDDDDDDDDDDDNDDDDDDDNGCGC